MSFELILLTAVVGALASLAVLKPKLLFEYPVVTSVLTWFFLIPQAWDIEASGDLNDFQPTTAWFYMLTCVLMTFAGFRAGTAGSKNDNADSLTKFGEQYDFDRIFKGALVVVGMGFVALLLMMREAATMTKGEAWSGPIALYAMLSGLVLFGGGLAWILYLNTGKKNSLFLAIFAASINIPFIILYARRELTFAVVTVFLLGIFFVKKKSVSRLLLVPMILIGSVLVTQTGAIRGYIAKNDTNLVDALTSGDIKTTKVQSSEMSSAVSDIALAQWNDSYTLGKAYINTLVQLYVPAFIVGRETKDAMKVQEDEDNTTDNRFYATGSTRTGFSDSFRGFHFFGCLIFFIISFVMGKLWKNAIGGDFKAQIYYTLLLAAGLKVFTESTSIFFGTAPLVLISIGAVFLYAKRPVPVGAKTGPALPQRAR